MSSFLVKSLRLTVLVGGLLALAACGGGLPDPESETDSESTPNPEKQQGYFIDGPVEGLNYSTSPGNLKGVTNIDGEYEYLDGDTVTFSIGKIVLGSATATGVVTPQNLVGGEIDDPQVVNIARLLMTLDADGEPDNGLQIPAQVRAAAAQLEDNAAQINFTDDNSFAIAARELITALTDDLVGVEDDDIYETAPLLVASLEAQIHLIESAGDNDGDGQINYIDTDDDADGLTDVVDNCPLISNPDQMDIDGDRQGNACDDDDDGDGVLDGSDNCRLIANTDQTDTDSDGLGNECDNDIDGDGIPNNLDPFPDNPDNTDTDGDGIHDNIDDDDDNDGFDDAADNCPLHVNADQTDTDGDGEGDACDTDDDNDGIPDEEDDNPLTPDAVTVTITGQIENGTISPSETQIINRGKTIEFTVTANSGYYPHISGCDGKLVATAFTTAAVNSDCTITLSFKPPTAPLNDTGATRCANADSYDLACLQAGLPRQDAEFGRDVTHNDDADGHAGFSFTKIDANGNELPASAAQWSCVKDNVTGLMWEVKTDDGGLRDKDNTYSWYSSNSNTNGGDAGTANGGSCADAGNCDTEKYAVSVNAVGLCGHSDWRLSSVSELYGIVNSGAYQPAIDATYFPNTVDDRYWTSSTYAYSGTSAWYVSFYSGGEIHSHKNQSFYVRLVRLNSD